MKRFYKKAAARRTDEGWQVELDGRPLRTPKRAPLILPTEAMAQAVAAEWDAQGDLIDPASMAMTGIANAAIDHVSADRLGFASRIAAYGETDLVCYRAGGPEPLAARQCAAWDPLIAWAARRYDIAFELTEGLMPQPQPQPTLSKLSAALEAFDDFALAAAQPIVTITGSLVLTLALLEGEIDAETAWRAGQVDELYQMEEWGADAEAEAVLARRRSELETAARFLSLR